MAAESLDVAILPAGARFSVANDEAGLAKLPRQVETKDGLFRFARAGKFDDQLLNIPGIGTVPRRQTKGLACIYGCVGCIGIV